MSRAPKKRKLFWHTEVGYIHVLFFDSKDQKKYTLRPSRGPVAQLVRAVDS